MPDLNGSSDSSRSQVDAAADRTATEELTFCVTMFVRGKKSHGRLVRTSWLRFLDALQHSSNALEKSQLGGWCPVTFRSNHRTLENVERVYALVLDIDNKVPGKKDKVPDEEIVDIDRVMAAFPGHEVYIYTSWSHDPDANWPRFRVVVPFERPVGKDEYPAIWRAYRDRLVERGIAIDEATRDASRLWYWSSTSRPGYEIRRQQGKPLAVSEILADVQDGDECEIAPSNLLSKVDRARKYLEESSIAIGGADGHKTAFNVVRDVVRGFNLDEVEAIEALTDWCSRCEPPWSEGELIHKIREARTKARGPKIGAYLGSDERPSNGARAASKAQETYVEREGQMFFKDQPLARFTARITKEVLRDDGSTASRLYVVQGRTADGVDLPPVEVPAEDFAEMQWVATKWGVSAVLAGTRGAWRHAAAAIQAASSPTVEHIYAHTGWRTIGGSPHYLLPGGAISVDGLQKVDCRPPGFERFGSAVPSRDKALEVLRHSISILSVGPPAVVAPALALVYTAPLASLIGGINFVTWMVGHSGTYKSALAALVQSHWGRFDFDSLPVSWASTANYLETQFSRGRDILLVIDNFVPAQNGYDQQASISKAVRLIQNIGDGQDRGRLDSNAEERPRRRPMAAVLATAEILPPDNTSTLGRCFCIEVDRGDVDLEKIRVVRQELELLQLSLGGYVQYLASLEPQSIKDTFERIRGEVLTKWSRFTAGRHSRLPDMLARLRTGVHFMIEYGATIGLDALEGRTYAFDLGLMEAAQKQPCPVVKTAVDLWLTTLRTMLRTHQVGLQSATQRDLAPDVAEAGVRPVPLIGWVAGEEVWLDQTASYKAVKDYLGADWRYSLSELGRQLKSATTDVDGTIVRILVKSERDNCTVKRTAGGARNRVLVLDRRVVGAEVLTGLRSVATEDQDYFAIDHV